MERYTRCFDEVFVASSGLDRLRRFWQATVHAARLRAFKSIVTRIFNP